MNKLTIELCLIILSYLTTFTPKAQELGQVNAFIDVYPLWSGDSGYLFFSSSLSRNEEIYQYDLIGGQIPKVH